MLKIDISKLTNILKTIYFSVKEYAKNISFKVKEFDEN